jgi:hypothetical protein
LSLLSFCWYCILFYFCPFLLCYSLFFVVAIAIDNIDYVNVVYVYVVYIIIYAFAVPWLVLWLVFCGRGSLPWQIFRMLE